MIFSNTKNFIITLFVVLAIYQTTRLWFEDSSNPSLFYSISDQSEYSKSSGYSHNLESIIVHTGNNKYINLYNNLNLDSRIEILNTSIASTLSSGDFIGEIDIDFKKDFNNKMVIYNFSYFNEPEYFTDNFRIPKKIADTLTQFDQIFIVPNQSLSETLQVILVNSQISKGYAFQTNRKSIVKEATDAITEICNLYVDFYYNSSVKSGLDLFSKNTFVPSTPSNPFEYPLISVKNPMKNDGGILLNDIEKYINIFFENPATKWSSNINNVYTYSDESTVVKYYNDAVLEYNNYRVKSSNTSNSFQKNYNIAVNFLLSDTNIKNEFYLSDYELFSDKSVFYFDYKVENSPVYLSEDKKASSGMKSMLEVTVSNNSVSKYRKFVYELEPYENSASNLNFLDAINKVYSSIGSTKPIDNLSLGYKVDGSNELSDLNWFINIDNQNYSIPISK